MNYPDPAYKTLSGGGLMKKVTAGAPVEYDTLKELAEGKQDKNKAYAPLEFSGLGKKTLEKNIVDVNGVNKNILTQAMVSDANTEFIVQYDYDLNDPNGESPITIPANCALKFEGGSINNGKIVFQDTSLESCKECFGDDLVIEGKVLQRGNPDWFTGSDADKIEKAILYFYDVECAARDYHITRAITVTHSFSLSGCSFPEFNGSSHSRTRLIADFSSATESENTIISIVGIPSGNATQKWLSVTVEGVSFVGSSDYLRTTNGVSISTPGGPSRPIIIRNCNFSNLKKGLNVYGSTSSASTNADNIKITTCNMSSNYYSVYAEGRHALGDITIDSCVIEQNIGAAIYFPKDANDYIPQMGCVKLCNLLLEGQSVPINIISDGTVIIQGCYFERGSGATSTISVEGGDGRSLLYMIGNTTSSQGAYNINVTMMTIKEYSNYFLTAPTLSLNSCIVDCEINRIDSCKSVFLGITNQYKPNATPYKTFKITPNIIEDGYYLLKVNANTSVNTSYTFAAGKYRFTGIVRTNSAANSIGPYKGSGVYWFYLLFSGSGATEYNKLYMFVHDYEFAESSTLVDMTFMVRVGEMAVSSVCAFTHSANIPRYNFNDYVNAFKPSNVTSQGIADMFIAGSINRPVFYNGTAWVDGDGYTPAAKSGTTTNRPTLTSGDAGFTYWDTDLGKMIAWNGTAWVNLDGTALS